MPGYTVTSRPRLDTDPPYYTAAERALGLGDVEALLALHRATFGSAVMQDGGDGGGDGAPPPATADGNGKGDEGKGGDGKPDAELGDAGKAALAAERKAAKDAKARADALEAELTKLREASQTEQEKALAAAQREAEKRGRDAVLGTVGTRLTEAAVVAYATGKLADPSDALALADLSEVKVDADSLAVDDAAVRKAVDDLLKRKPHLAAKRTNGSGDGGARPPAPDGIEPGAARIRAAYEAASSTR